jgi:hypothetical protein
MKETDLICKKPHCRCMNLDKQCPHHHYSDSCYWTEETKIAPDDWKERCLEEVKNMLDNDGVIQQWLESDDKTSAILIINNSLNIREVMLKAINLDPDVIEYLENTTPEDIEKLKKISRLNKLKKEVEKLEEEISK